ncbi:pilus assembly PilX family protein [Paraglaciecola aestuariivivens]
MCLNTDFTYSSKSLAKQQGSMLVIALFVIIVLGLLGITLTRLLAASSDSIIHEVLGQRAFNAAKSGIDCAVAAQFGAGCSQPTSFTFNGVPGLENCSYSVISNNTAVQDGAKNFTHWSFTSTGQCTAGKIMVSRTVYIDAKL